MVEWFSSRRDSPIVARHEVLGSDAERQPRPGGTVEVVVSPEWREDKERLGRSPGRVRLRPNRGFPWPRPTTSPQILAGMI
jgi:hypothetical protein